MSRVLMGRVSRNFVRVLLATIGAVLVLPGTALGGPSTTYSSGNLAAAIPDSATLESSIPVAEVGEILALEVAVNLGHGQDDQVNLDLVHPDGTVVRLAHDKGGTGDNYGSGSDCTGGFTEFTDQAAASISAGAPPFLGEFRPEQPLSPLKARSTNGAWRLVVTDDTAGVVGTLWCWKLTITYAQSDLSLAVTDFPDPVVVGENLNYVNVITNTGPDPSTRTRFTALLPAGVAFASVASTQGTCAGATTIACELGGLAGNTSATVTITVTATAVGSLSYSGSVEGTPDPPGLTGNNGANATTTVTSSPSVRDCTITGTDGDDVLAGTNGDDVICGLGGNDRILAGVGDDVVYGDGGNDRLFGGRGADRLLGGPGDDWLTGEEGGDVGFGGLGNDRLRGDEGRDYLRGGGGEDVLNGAEGADVLVGRGDGARDTLRGGPGKDSGVLDAGLDVRRSVEQVLRKAPPPPE